MRNTFSKLIVPLVCALACEELDDDNVKHSVGDPALLSLDNVAMLLSELPVGREQLREVHDAVSASSSNGYDEEYMMRDLFDFPGAGVGDDRLPADVLRSRRKMMKSGAGSYGRPLKDMIRTYLQSSATKSSGENILNGMTAEAYMESLRQSDIQIYWPNSQDWDGTSLPVITFDPADDSEVNVGYGMELSPEGDVVIVDIEVSEATAAERPVWVVNRNDDSRYTSLELLRMLDPEWGTGGGDIVVSGQVKSKVVGAGSQSLVLKDFTMFNHYDNWFSGASEFFVKIGSVENFTASTEAELKLYTPQVTDFMIVVKRRFKGETLPFNALMVSDWTPQLTHCAFIVTEDDGGTKSSWKCSAMVKYNSKSYGFEIEIPINRRDDIVWRGQLSRKSIMANDGIPIRFGDVAITFETVDL